MLKLFLLWPVGTPSGGLLNSCDQATAVFDSLLPFWHNEMFLDWFCKYSAHSWIQPFLQGALVPFSKKWYLDTTAFVLGVLIANGVLNTSLHVILF